jgi:hypothetical protein
MLALRVRTTEATCVKLHGAVRVHEFPVPFGAT